MNNISCEIIQDLLPLYCDGVCSEESKQLILVHMQTCGKCREELRVLESPLCVPENNEELEASRAAAKAWKKNKRKAFRMGILLMSVILFISAAVFLVGHYLHSSSLEDTIGLREQLVSYSNAPQLNMQNIVQKGDYLAVAGCDADNRWYLGLFVRDDIFVDRWTIIGSLNKVKTGKLANWNYNTSKGDTILVCFGAKLSSKIRGYTFENSGVSYTCTVNSDSVLDIFYILDTYDSETHIEPIY